MNKVIIEFTLNGRKNTYYRRTDLYGTPLITTNVNSAKKVKESDAKGIIAQLIKEHGKNNVTDINLIKEDETQK